MKITKINVWVAFSFLLFMWAPFAQAQKTKSVQKNVETKSQSNAENENKIKDMVEFFEYLLNTLGSKDTPTRDKDVVITQSYSKIFRDGKVQIEDDLDENRRVITNKDVQAYLKDVEFFFKDVKFDFSIDKIEQEVGSDKLFYKVSLTRNLSGITAEGKKINNTMPRFIEVNFNPKDQDLKIVSIYTNQFNEKEALRTWWKQLSYEWQEIFKRSIHLSSQDSVGVSDIKAVTQIEALNLSYNAYIQTIEPVSLLTNLKQLNISGTFISDITPLRNLTELVDLNLTRTNVRDISPLKYCSKLKRLNVDHTYVSIISVVENMPELQQLNIAHTEVKDIGSLASLAELATLNAEYTKVSDVTSLASLQKLQDINLSSTIVKELLPLANLASLSILNVDSTRVSDLKALSMLKNLKLLYINHTPVSSLSPLDPLPHLEKIYCDHTFIKNEDVEAFKVSHPNVLVISDSKDLSIWWTSLSDSWKEILSKAAKISLNPAKEELARISKLDSINLDEKNIQTLDPLLKLPRVRSISAQKTSISEISLLGSLKELTYLNVSETNVYDLSVLNQLSKAKEVRANKTKIENIDYLSVPHLQVLWVDQTAVNDFGAKQFLKRNPKCLLIYKSKQLEGWWNSLPDSWKEVFLSQPGISTSPSKAQLHSLVEQKTIKGKDVAVSNLNALSEFVCLEELHLSATAITTLTFLENLRSLKSLQINNSPLMNIEAVSAFTELETLDVSNTPLDDIYEVWRLKKLKKLDCAGTQIKRLNGLEKLENLEYFDCSNTFVNRLSSLDYIKLKTLKCFNTKVPTRIIENFKESHPECSVMYYR